jgi:putative ABC transport system ATP-binding protein
MLDTQIIDKPIIICENLVRIYKVADLEVVALQGLDLAVRRGEMLGIVGASGSGKTTLMNILGGLDRPSAGRVSVDGMDLLALSERGLNLYQRKKVGFVWQQTARNLIPYLSAIENVELPMTMSRTYGLRKKREAAMELLDSVGLSHRKNSKLVQLSGGEQQRVAIAVALANRPVLLLGDEPTGEVDSVTAQVIMDTFRKLAKMMDLTIIIVTHDPRIAGQVDRVIAIRDGKISTETIRKVNPTDGVLAGEPGSDVSQVGQKEHITYHEYVVLDTAGRLQVPREWLEKLKIGRRAQLDFIDDRIIIHPEEGAPQGAETEKMTIEQQIASIFKDEPPPSRQSFFSRFKRKKS